MKFFLKLIIITISLNINLMNCYAEKTSIVLGTSPDYPPFEFISQGQIKGLDIDIAFALAKELNYQLKIENIEFNNLVQALNSKKIDLIISSMTATEKRLKNINFSKKYYFPTFAIISNKKYLINVKKNFKKKIIGVQMGSTMETYIHDRSKNQNLELEIVSRNSNLQLIQELLIGHIDGIIVEQTQAIAFVKKNKQLTYSSIHQNNEGYAIACRKNENLIKIINHALTKIENSGILQQIIDKWILNN